jgi:hypothetical protein
MARKAKKKGGSPAKKAEKIPAKKSAAKRSTAKPKKEADFVQVRKNIASLVEKSAKEIATKVIEAAKTGQLPQTKYIFEAVGLYPPTEETLSRPADSLASTLLRRMGLPTEPVACEEEPPISLPNSLRPAREPGEDGDSEDAEAKDEGEGDEPKE